MMGKPKFVLKCYSYCCSDSDCGKKFKFFTKRHHCRACGEIFCTGCTKNKIYLKYMDRYGKVCNDCCLNLEDTKGETSQRPITDLSECLERQLYERQRGKDAPRCCRCTRLFGIFKRKKYCGECQKSFCSKCRKYQFPQPPGKALKVCYFCLECGLKTPPKTAKPAQNMVVEDIYYWRRLAEQSWISDEPRMDDFISHVCEP